MTSIEMEGFSISLLRLDDELKELLDAKADTPHLSLRSRRRGRPFALLLPFQITGSAG